MDETYIKVKGTAKYSSTIHSTTAGQYIFQVCNGQVQNNVPEPASLALSGLSLAGLAVVRKRKST